MKKQVFLTKLFLLCALIVGSVSESWAVSKPWSGNDPATTLDLATITSSTMGTWKETKSWFLDDNYLVLSGYASYQNVSSQTWITNVSVGSSNTDVSTDWLESTPFKGNTYYTTAKYATIQSGRYLLYKVTNLKSLKVYGKNNNTSKYLDIFIYTKSGENSYTKVEEKKYTSDSNVHIWSNSETLDPSETYYIYITGVSSSNSRVYEVAFERNNTITKHSLSSAVSPANSGTVTLGETSVGEGLTTTISASAADGYRFVNWTCTGTGASIENANSASTIFTMGTEDATVTANFEVIPTHTLFYTVTPEGAGVVVLGSNTVKEGFSTSIEASANSGYKFTGWTVSGEGATLEDNTLASTNLTMGTEDATVTANFTAVETHAISWSVNDVIIKIDNVEDNTAINLAAPTTGIPTGYVFKGWVTEANKIDTPTDTDPSANYVTSATSTEDITYYAVMAIESGGIETATLTASHTTSNTSYADHTYTDNKGNEWSGNNSEPIYSGTSYFAIKSTSGSYFESPTFSGNITEIKMMTYNGSGSKARYIYINSSKGSNTGDLAKIEMPSDEKFTVEHSADLSESGDFNKFYIGTNDGTNGFSYIVVSYGSITTTNYCTTISNVTIAPAKEYVSYSNNVALDFTSVEGLTAFAVTINSDNASVKLTPVKKVPANTGLVLKKTGEATSYDVPVLTGDADEFANQLLPTGTEGVTVAERSVYVLSGGIFKVYTGTSIAAGKAYLPKNTDAPSLSLGFGEETTGMMDNRIETISNNQFYTLDGRRVENPTKGIYILNGKKVIVK